MTAGGCRFFADSMLGKLARWMRTLGYDVEYERAIEDAELIKRALIEGRTILTRDTLLVRRRGVRGRYLFIESDEIGCQLRQVAGRFPLGKDRILTRCIRCNMLLLAADPSSVKDIVPPYVSETQREFSSCQRCGRIYWSGTHRERMLEDLSRLLGEGWRA